MSLPTLLPRPSTGDPSSGYNSWIVTVYNNDVNTYDEVVLILMVATSCTQDEAEMETWEIDRLGKSVVHQSSEEECKRIAEIIATIGIRVEVKQD